MYHAVDPFSKSIGHSLDEVGKNEQSKKALTVGDDTLTDQAATATEGTLTDATLADAARRASAVSLPAGTPDAETYAKDTLLLDTYQILSAPIKGGMGMVYRVHHTGWNVDLAVKRPMQSYFQTEQQKTAFIGECERWINLGLHPNIVSCYYVRELDGIPSVFSEWMDGGSLSDQIRSGKLYQGTDAEVQERLLDISIQFARGLLYSHQNRLIHQDVKPGNLMLTKDYEAKVTDFGISGGGAGKDASGWSGACTREYASAEQQRKGPFTPKTDMYSWAVSVLMMYCSSRPWQNGIDAGLDFDKHAQNVKVPLSGGLKALLKNCLEQDVNDRPESFAPVIEALLAEYQTQTGQAYPREEPTAAADTADSLNNRALSFLDLGKPEEARTLFGKALSANPNHFQALYNDTLLGVRGGSLTLEKAEKRIAASAVALKEWQPPYLTGLLKMEHGEFGPALELFQKARDSGAPADELAGPMEKCGEGASPVLKETPLPQCAYDDRGVFSAGGDRLLTINGRTFRLTLQELQSGAVLYQTKGVGPEMGRCPLSASDNLTVALVYSEFCVDIIDGAAADGRKRLMELERSLERSRLVVYSAGISGGGRLAYVVSGPSSSRRGELRVFDVSSGECLYTLEEAWHIVRFSPDARSLLTQLGNAPVSLRNARTGTEQTVFENMSALCAAAAFTPDGRYLINTAQDKAQRIPTGYWGSWDTGSGKEAERLRLPAAAAAASNTTLSVTNDRRWAAVCGTVVTGAGNRVQASLYDAVSGGAAFRCAWSNRLPIDGERDGSSYRCPGETGDPD